MEHVEQFIKSGELTNEAFWELKDFILCVIAKKNYSQFLNISKDHLANELVEHVIERLPKFDSSRSKLSTFISTIVMNNLKNRLRASFRQQKNVHCVNSVVVQDGEEIDILDLLSFKKSLEQGTSITNDREFVAFVISFWRDNSNLYCKGKKLKVVNAIVDILLNGETYSDPNQLAKQLNTTRSTIYEAMQTMRSVNHKLYVKWQKGEI